MPKSLQQAIHAYQSSRLIGCTHADLVLMAYDSAIAACHKQNGGRALSVIKALQLSLTENENIELAAQLNQFYNVCRLFISRQQYDDAAILLGSMREALQ